MADASSNPQSGVDWEDVCLDPHHHALQQGKMEGRKAGALAGFREGQALGQTKGLEFGLEIGFYQGVIAALRQKEEWNDRIQHSLDKLQDAINDFPCPDQVFAAANDETYSSNENSRSGWMNKSSSHSTDRDRENDHDSEDVAKLDILNKVQRIRARFKLLTVQLGKPHFSLQHALEPPSLSGRQATEDNDW